MLVLFIQACEKKNCSPCFSYETVIRLSFENSGGQNLLNPNTQNNVVVDKVTSSTGQTVNFELTNQIGGFDTGYWFIELKNRPNRPGCNDLLECALCVNEECELYVSYSYKNSITIDTLNILYEEFREVDEDGCVCTSYPLKYFKYNGDVITEYNTTTGAAIIKK